MKFSVIKRYILFTLSLIVTAAGYAAILRANMGAVPTLCPPYVLARIPGQGLSPGILAMIMYVVFLVLTMIINYKKPKNTDLLQIPFSILLGFLIDSFLILMRSLQWEDNIWSITIRILQILIGIILILAARITRQKCRIFTSEENLIRSLSTIFNVEYFKVKTFIDVALVLIGIIFCVFYFGTLKFDMIGIGTAISLIIFGLEPQLNSKIVSILNITNNDEAAAAYEYNDDENSFPIVITISRMHGSGGHEIGSKVAQQLGIKFYDKEIINATAHRLGINEKTVKELENDSSLRHITRNENIFETQSRIISEIAKESCVIIGRCANYVLRNRPFCLSIFMRCDEDYAVTLIRNKDNLSEAQAREVIRIKNNAREKHYSRFAGGKWQDPANYDLIINTAKIGSERAVDVICNAVQSIINNEQ